MISSIELYCIALTPPLLIKWHQTKTLSAQWSIHVQIGPYFFVSMLRAGCQFKLSSFGILSLSSFSPSSLAPVLLTNLCICNVSHSNMHVQYLETEDISSYC